MRINLFILLVIMGNLAFGQTANHKKVLGTKCSLIPPAGFVAATNFSGFQNTELGASIMVVEVPGPIQSVTESFTAETLKSKGMTLLDKQAIDFNNSKAIFIKISQPGNGTLYFKQMLVFGDEKHTVLINGIYPMASKAIETDMKTSLLSTSYNAGQDDNPLDAVKFSIDASGTEFKLAKGMAGSLIYTTDGKISTQNPSIIVGNSLANVVTENQKQYSLDRFKKLPGAEAKTIKETNPVTIDNLKGFEIVADGKDKEAKEEVVYQVMLFNEGEYFILVGSATEDLKNNLEVFRKIAKTFKRK